MARVWFKLLTLSLILFFLFLADAILSFWAPNLIQDLFGSSAAMGFIISFSSVAGILTDCLLPQLLREVTVKKLIIWAFLGIIGFALSLLLGIAFPQVAVFLMAMGFWGLYCEFFGFASHQFIAEAIPFKFHASSWAFLGIFRNLAYLLGPLLGGWLVLKDKGMPAWGAIFFALIAGLILLFSKKVQNRPVEVDLKQISLIKEFEHWYVLARQVWPMVVLSLCLGLIDSIFWTTGAVWTESLIKQSFWGAFLIPAYQLPSLFMGLLVVRWRVFEGKKKLAMQFLLLAGIFLAALGLTRAVPLIILLVFISSCMLAVTFPLADAVYSDIVARLGRKRDHLIGLTGSTINIAYIIGPILAGFTTMAIGERMTFSFLGITAIFLALILLVYTPRKLRLPQTEIKNWKK